MNFAQAVNSCFRKYITFSGRAPRSEYWYFWLFFLLVSTALTILNTSIYGPSLVVSNETIFAQDGTQSIERVITKQYSSGWAGTIFSVIVFVPGLAVAWRRIHDIGRSGWWIVAPFAVSFALVFSVMLATIGWTALIGALFATGNVSVEAGKGALIASVAILGMFFTLLIWLCGKSQPGTNKFGPNPHTTTS